MNVQCRVLECAHLENDSYVYYARLICDEVLWELHAHFRQRNAAFCESVGKVRAGILICLPSSWELEGELRAHIYLLSITAVPERQIL